MFSDAWTRTAYSVDASHYEITPLAVVHPADQEDVQNICRVCSAENQTIVARGAGTGLLGQALSDGIVLDFTKHMNQLLEIEEDYVVVQPGIVKGVLDRELRKRGKWLPADPASSNYCTLGGMIANNSSGIHCLGYGDTVDFFEGARFVFSDGSAGYASSSDCDDRTGRLQGIVEPAIAHIQRTFPKVRKNSCGYRLDSVMRHGKFQPHKILAASECTLAIVTQAKFRIMDLPEHRSLGVAGFSDLGAAIASVPALLKLEPVALEMMDHTVVSISKNGSANGCLLFIEFAGAMQWVDRQLRACLQIVGQIGSTVEYASDSQSLDRIWGARRGALNNIMKLTVGSRKPIGLIEDTVVPVDMLGTHVEGILHEYKKKNLDYVMYGHAGDGNIHTRPLVDLDSEPQAGLVEGLAANVFRRVVASGGTITGEHGDGLARTPYIEMLYGPETLRIFKEVKELFDPQFLLNPGKKLSVRVQ